MAGWNGYDHRLCRCYSGGIHDQGLRESLRSFYCGEVERVKVPPRARKRLIKQGSGVDG